jgi:hypothetical protein
MNRKVSLTVAVEIQFANRHAVFDWFFVDSSADTNPMPCHFSRQSGIQ